MPPEHTAGCPQVASPDTASRRPAAHPAQAHPSPTNILEWHYCLEGAAGTEYEGGCYHGKITFPTQYPYKPPSIQMLTPNGRFAPERGGERQSLSGGDSLGPGATGRGCARRLDLPACRSRRSPLTAPALPPRGRFAVATRLCLSMTDFHPESWNPLWSISTILTGLLSFMADTAHTTGAIETSREDKVRFAGESLAYNLRNPTFRKLFPEWAERAERGPPQQAQQAQQAQAAEEEGGTAPGKEGGKEGAQAPEEPAAWDGDAAPAPAAGQAPQQQQQRGGGGEGGEAWGGVMLGAAIVGVAGAAMAVSYLNIDQPPQ